MRSSVLSQQPGIVAGIEHDFVADRAQLPVERHFGFVDQIAAAHLDAVDTELRGDGVEQALAHERALVAPRRAIGRGRRLVGQPVMSGHLVVRDAIGPRQHAGGEVDDAGAVRAHIGALVVEEHVVDAEDVAVGIDRGADLVALLARMVGGDEMLVAVLDPLHRPTETHARRGRPARPRDKARRARRSRRRHGLRTDAATSAGGSRSWRSAPGCDAAPWRRRAAPACRGRHRSARWRRGSPAACRYGGRSRRRPRPRRGRTRNACSMSP